MLVLLSPGQTRRPWSALPEGRPETATEPSRKLSRRHPDEFPLADEAALHAGGAREVLGLVPVIVSASPCPVALDEPISREGHFNAGSKTGVGKIAQGPAKDLRQDPRIIAAYLGR